MAGRHPFARLRAGMTSKAQAEAEAEAIGSANRWRSPSCGGPCG